MKQKRNEQTPISEHGVRILIMMILVGFGILIGRADANKAHREDAEQVAEPQVVQHEVVLRVAFAQGPPEKYADFCSADDCWWKFPATVVITVIGGGGGFIFILYKIT